MALAACLKNELFGKDGCRNNGIANVEKIYFWHTPQAACATQRFACPMGRITDYRARALKISICGATPVTNPSEK